MTDSTGTPGPDRPGLLTPTSRAVAGLALAVTGLLGGNSLAGSIQVLAMSGPEAGDPGVHGVVLGISTAVPAGVALLLTRAEARGPVLAWQDHVSRAAVVVALLVLAASGVMVIGGFLQF